MHLIDRRLAAVCGAECAPNLARYLRLTVPALAFALSQKHQHRAPPTRTGESGTERAGPTRRHDDRIEFGRAAVVKLPAGFVGLIEQLTEPLQVPAGKQLCAEPGACCLPDDMERAGAERLGQRALEARQPGRGPAGEPAELRQLQPEAGGPPLSPPPPLPQCGRA